MMLTIIMLLEKTAEAMIRAIIVNMEHSFRNASWNLTVIGLFVKVNPIRYPGFAEPPPPRGTIVVCFY
jgi:hypothetical protein